MQPPSRQTPSPTRNSSSPTLSAPPQRMLPDDQQDTETVRRRYQKGTADSSRHRRAGVVLPLPAAPTLPRASATDVSKYGRDSWCGNCQEQAHRQQVCVLNIDGFDQQYSLGFTSRRLFGPARPMSRLIRAVTEQVAPFHPVDQWPPVRFAKGSGRRLVLRSTGRAPGVPQASGTSN